MSGSEEPRKTLNEADLNVIADRIIERYESHRTAVRGVDAETRRRHHEWWEAEIERRAARAAFWQDIKKKVIGWAVIGILAGVISLVAIIGNILLEYVVDHMQSALEHRGKKLNPTGE